MEADKHILIVYAVCVAAYLDKYVKKLEEKYLNELLKTVYAGVNRKSVDDPDMIQFFKFKYWL